MQATTAQQGTTTAQATQNPGSLAREFVFKYLTWATQELKEADTLHALFMKRSPSAERDAIWSGYWALRCSANTRVERLRERGGLLFFGQPEAIKAAHALAKATA